MYGIGIAKQNIIERYNCFRYQKMCYKEYGEIIRIVYEPRKRRIEFKLLNGSFVQEKVKEDEEYLIAVYLKQKAQAVEV